MVSGVVSLIAISRVSLLLDLHKIAVIITV